MQFGGCSHRNGTLSISPVARRSSSKPASAASSASRAWASRRSGAESHRVLIGWNPNTSVSCNFEAGKSNLHSQVEATYTNK